jgi:hypothetical protein
MTLEYNFYKITISVSLFGLRNGDVTNFKTFQSNKDQVTNEQVGLAVTVWTCIREVLGSNLGWQHRFYRVKVFRVLSRSLLADVGMVPR